MYSCKKVGIQIKAYSETHKGTTQGLMSEETKRRITGTGLRFINFKQYKTEIDQMNGTTVSSTEVYIFSTLTEAERPRLYTCLNISNDNSTDLIKVGKN